METEISILNSHSESNHPIRSYKSEFSKSSGERVMLSTKEFRLGFPCNLLAAFAGCIHGHIEFLSVGLLFPE